jgi:Ca2+-binding EF-hand superfamily protein
MDDRQPTRHRAARRRPVRRPISLADEAVENFRDAFDALDERGSGTISLSELRSLLQMVDESSAPDEDSLRRMVASVAVDAEGSGGKAGDEARVMLGIDSGRREVPVTESDEEDLRSMFEGFNTAASGGNGRGDTSATGSGGTGVVGSTPTVTTGTALSSLPGTDVQPEVPKSGSDSLTFEHFLRFATSYLQFEEQKLSAKQVFRVFDTNCNGTISVTELAQVLNRDFGMGVTLEEVEAMISIADESADGELNLREFRTIFAQVKLQD